jgi:hypothetical protein
VDFSTSYPLEDPLSPYFIHLYEIPDAPESNAAMHMVSYITDSTDYKVNSIDTNVESTCAAPIMNLVVPIENTDSLLAQAYEWLHCSLQTPGTDRVSIL